MLSKHASHVRSRFALILSAPRAGKMSKASVQAGFSLIEIIIVLGILGTLIAVLVGGIAGGGDKAKKGATTVRAGQLQQHLLKYQSDVGKMPSTSEGLASLTTNPGNSKWAGPYGNEEDQKDDWGNGFEYELTPKGVKLTSPGADSQTGTEDDIAYVNGRIVEASPEGQPAQGGPASAP